LRVGRSAGFPARGILLALVALPGLLAGCAASLPAGKGTVLVVGGGQSGQPLARTLVAQGYDVRVMVRDPARASGLPADARVVSGDATRPDTLAAGFAGADYVIATLGSSCVRDKPFPPQGSPEDVDYRGVANLVDAAKAAGVRQFVLMSALGAGDANPRTPLNAMCGMALSFKGQGEDHLRSSGLPYTIVRPGGLKPFPGQAACQEGREPLALYAGSEDRGPGALCRADVGLVMASALGNAEARNKTVNVIADRDKAAPVDGWRSRWAALPADVVPPPVGGVTRSSLFQFRPGDRLEDGGRLVVTGGRFARAEDFEVVRRVDGGRTVTSITTADDGQYRVEGRWTYTADEAATGAAGLGTIGGQPVTVDIRSGVAPTIGVTRGGRDQVKTAACPAGCLIDMTPSALPMFTMTRLYDAGRGGEQPFNWIGQSLIMDQTLLEGVARLRKLGEGRFGTGDAAVTVVQYAFVETLKDEATGQSVQVPFNLYVSQDHKPLAFAVGSGTVAERVGYEGLTQAMPVQIPKLP